MRPQANTRKGDERIVGHLNRGAVRASGHEDELTLSIDMARYRGRGRSQRTWRLEVAEERREDGRRHARRMIN